ncbi:MAG: hypothetical protein FJ104_08575, partial [Deltaproteobacteria bacterium]|nr:hypothetical protein [Deltaproteobacteria bacterium]
MLPVGGSFVVTMGSAADYVAYFPTPPDAETGTGVAAVPDAPPATGWSATQPSLPVTGDELVLVDPTFTILDVVPYGSGSYTGVNALTPMPANNQVARRTPTGSDTDDADVDFAIPGVACATTANCGACRACTEQACTITPGAACSDGNACNGAETCSAGACTAGTPLTCNDGTPCTVDSCSPASGCAAAPASAATSCSDGNLCNGLEFCDGAGTCGRSSGALTCDDGDPCNGPDVCSGSTCKPTGPELTCDDGSDCTKDSCVTGVGCAATPLAAGETCVDGNACTKGDACDGLGNCGGSVVVCVDPAPTCVNPSTSRTFSRGSCQAGECQVVPADQPCTAGCNATTGLCENDPCAGVVCTKPAGPCSTGQGVCSGGVCSFPNLPEGATCDDGNPCTALDKCDADGACGGTPLQCNSPAPPTCQTPTVSAAEDPVGFCQGGTCQYRTAIQNCTSGCDATTGLCAGDPCVGIECLTPGGPCELPVGSCDQGNCQYGLRPAGTPCDDGDACTAGDACDA